MKLLINKTTAFNSINVAENFFAKLFGLFIQNPPLYIKNCNSIHTLFMKNNIDIIFLNKNNKVVKIYENVTPNKIIFPINEGKNIIELNASFIKSAKIKIGDLVELEE